MIASGNSTFQDNRDLETVQTSIKITFLICDLHAKRKIWSFFFGHLDWLMSKLNRRRIFCAVCRLVNFWWHAFEFGALFHHGVSWKQYQRNKESSKSKQNIQGDQQFIQAKFSGGKKRLLRKKLALILFQTWDNQNEWNGDRCHHSRLREWGKLHTFHSSWN